MTTGSSGRIRAANDARLGCYVMLFSVCLLVSSTADAEEPKELERVTVTGKRIGFMSSVAHMMRMVDSTGRNRPEEFRWKRRGETIAEQLEKDCEDTPTAPSVTPATAGNPIVLSTGNKIEPELDFTSSGEMGLFLQRTYNHYWSGAGLFGKHWVSNFDYKLTFGSLALNSCFPRQGGGTCGIGGNTVIYAWRPDGRTLKFTMNASDGIFYDDRPNSLSRIVKQTDGSFVLYGDDNEVETYSSGGYVSTVKDEQGIGWTFTYTNSTYPYRVTHTSGRYVEFTWTDTRLTSVRDPAGNYYGYSYAANQFGTGLHRLSATSRPGTPTTAIAYHYELRSGSLGPDRENHR